MNIIISSDNMRRSYAFNLRGWRAPVALGIALLVAWLVIYRSAHGIAQYWANNGDERVRWMVEEIRERTDAERLSLWNSTVNRLEQEITNLQVQLWQLSSLGNSIAERMGLEDEVLIEVPLVPETGNYVEETEISADEKISKLDAKLYELDDIISKEQLRITQMGATTSFASMRWATIPIATPIEGRYWLTSGYGTRSDPFANKKAFHAGYDYAARTGTPVLAAADGIVYHRGRLGNYGKTVEIYHGDSISTLYAHLSDYKVEEGDFVSRGQIIALVGSTGRSSGPHLHYEIRRKNRAKPYTHTIKELLAARPEIASFPSPQTL